MSTIALPVWVDLRTACAYKGVTYTTVANRPELQPHGGVADAYMGRRVWRASTI